MPAAEGEEDADSVVESSERRRDPLSLKTANREEERALGVASRGVHVKRPRIWKGGAKIIEVGEGGR